MQPHLKIDSRSISPFVLLPGDPARVDLIGLYLSDFKILVQNREFRVGVGNYNGITVTVCSTGIGCPSTAIAVEELVNAGAKCFIRVGTCGGAWRSDVPVGSIVIPSASIRDEGSTKEYIPEGFPAVADFSVLEALVASAKKNKVCYSVGINRTHDSFYGNQNSITKWGAYLLDERWKQYDTPILSSEMESAALFVVATLRNVKAGAVLAVNAEPESLKDRLFGRSQSVVVESDQSVTEQVVAKTIIVALEALRLVATDQSL